MTQIRKGAPPAGEREIGKGRSEQARLARIDRAERRERGDQAARRDADEARSEAQRRGKAERLRLMTSAAVGENPG